jgi:hypothetical protein
MVIGPERLTQILSRSALFDSLSTSNKGATRRYVGRRGNQKLTHAGSSRRPGTTFTRDSLGVGIS